MLISLFFWIYISLLSLIWGHMILCLAAMPSVRHNTSWPHTSLVCFAGLAVIAILSFGISLAAPLDLTIHLLFLLCGLLWLLNKEARTQIGLLLRSWFKNYVPFQFVLLTACVAMVLVISSHTITHPDTLIYHAKSILTLQRYGSISGISNLRVQLGFQSSWFAALAIMNPIRGQYHIIFLNGAVLCWFFAFLIGTLRQAWSGWLLLAYTLTSWTQIRLTAASPSPDFIVSLYCWAAFMTLLDKTPAIRNYHLILTILFCLGAILTKMSGNMIMLLAIPAAASGRLATNLKLLAWSFVSITVLCAKNFLESGYLLYPSSWPDLFQPRWKVPLTQTRYALDYIAFYATTPHVGPGKAESLTQGQKIAEWWRSVDLPDQLIIIAIVSGLLIWAGLMIAGRHRAILAGKNKFPLFVAFAGSAIWFFSAPSPRFGTGFLIPLAWFIWAPLARLPRLAVSSLIRPRLTLLAAGCMITAVSVYTIYRCVNFTSSAELLLPAGIAQEAYKPIGCHEIKADLLHDTFSPSPNLPYECPSAQFSDFRPMGRSIREGFEPGTSSP